MSFSFTTPIVADLDKVRFLIQDTTSPGLISDEEIDYALSVFSNVHLAAAMVLRALGMKYGRSSGVNIGNVSATDADIDSWQSMADQYDPSGVTKGSSAMVLPIFGGQSIDEKETLSGNGDVPQPWFTRSGDDIPGGPDGTDTDYDN